MIPFTSNYFLGSSLLMNSHMCLTLTQLGLTMDERYAYATRGADGDSNSAILGLHIVSYEGVKMQQKDRQYCSLPFPVLHDINANSQEKLK